MNAQWYRNRADFIRAVAEQVVCLEVKRELLRIANRWESLAYLVEHDQTQGWGKHYGTNDTG